MILIGFGNHFGGDKIEGNGQVYKEFKIKRYHLNQNFKSIYF